MFDRLKYDIELNSFLLSLEEKPDPEISKENELLTKFSLKEYDSFFEADNFIKRISQVYTISEKEKIRINFKVKQKLMSEFLKYKLSDSILDKIFGCYVSVKNKIQVYNLVGYTGVDTNDEASINSMINKDIGTLTSMFQLQLDKMYDIFCRFPSFLTDKYKKIIRYKFLHQLKYNSIDIRLFDLNEFQTHILRAFELLEYKNNSEMLFMNRYFNLSNEDILTLFILSNSSELQKEETFDVFVESFSNFVEVLEIPLPENVSKEYALNLLINKYKLSYIDFPPENAEEFIKTRVEIILSLQNSVISSIILTYTLLCNQVIYKKENQLVISMPNHYSQNAKLRSLLFNFLHLFSESIDTESLAFYIQNSLIYKHTSALCPKTNFFFPIESIKDTLLKSPNNVIAQISDKFFKNVISSKLSAVKELTNIISKVSKEKDIKTISLYPSLPRYHTPTITILISGFLSENVEHEREWDNFLPFLKDKDLSYYYNWPGESIKSTLGESLFQMSSALMSFVTPSSSTMANYTPLEVFRMTSKRGQLSGMLLGLILASRSFFPFQAINLVGFSLGTHVIKHCLKMLYKINQTSVRCDNIIENVVLMGGATSVIGKEKKIGDVFNTIVNGKVFHCYSAKDEVLQTLYKIAMKKNPIGIKELNIEGCKKINNFDFTQFNMGHLDYRNKMDLVLNTINISKS